MIKACQVCLKASRAASFKRWRKKHPEKYKAHRRKHQQKHQVRLAAYLKAWRANNRRKAPPRPVRVKKIFTARELRETGLSVSDFL